MIAKREPTQPFNIDIIRDRLRAYSDPLTEAAIEIRDLSHKIAALQDERAAPVAADKPEGASKLDTMCSHGKTVAEECRECEREFRASGMRDLILPAESAAPPAPPKNAAYPGGMPDIEPESAARSRAHQKPAPSQEGVGRSGCDAADLIARLDSFAFSDHRGAQLCAKAAAALRAAQKRIAELEDRLELTATCSDGSKVKLQIGTCDGIGCRDATIKLQDDALAASQEGDK